MEISLKIKIYKNQQFSLSIEKHPEIAGVLNNLSNVLKAGCHNVIIKDKDEHFQITSFESTVTLSIIQSFIEVAYINFTGYEDTN